MINPPNLTPDIVLTVFNIQTFWLLIAIAFLIIEEIAPGLVSIWFAVGAIATMFVTLIPTTTMKTHLICFVMVSAASLAITRPIVKKYVNSKPKPTNADRLIGKEYRVLERIDNMKETGTIKVNGVVWTARMMDKAETAKSGDIVVVRKIEGSTLFVSAKKE